MYIRLKYTRSTRSHHYPPLNPQIHDSIIIQERRIQSIEFDQVAKTLSLSLSLSLLSATNLWIRPLWKRSAFIRKPSLFAASRYQWTNRWNLTVIYRCDPTTAVLGHGNYARKIPSLPIENSPGEESFSPRSRYTLAKSTAAGHYNGSAGLYFNVIANFQRSIGSLAWQIANAAWLAGREWFIAWPMWNRAFGRWRISNR